MNITRRQKEVLDFIEAFIEEFGFSPTYQEIATGVGLGSLATVSKHLENLQKRGRIMGIGENRSRAIEVVHSGEKARFYFLAPERLWDSLLNCYWVKEENAIARGMKKEEE